MHKPIAILGGMGPQASLRFHELLVTESQLYHSGNGEEFPYLVHFSLPVEDFISDTVREAATAQLLDELTGAFQMLRPQTITLACNTAHRLVPRCKLLQRPEFVSMLETVATVIAGTGTTRVGLLASPNTVHTKLYETVLSQHGVATIRPDGTELPGLERVIRHVIAGKAGARDRAVLRSTAHALLNRGAEAILLGCTELPLVFDAAGCPVPVHDCLEIYARAVIRQYYNVTE